MASETESQPHFPCPKLGREAARSCLKDKVEEIFTEAIGRHEQLKIPKDNRNYNKTVFQEAQKISLPLRLPYLLQNFRIGLYPENYIPIRKQIVAAAGIGKTTEIIRNLKRASGMTIWFMVPTLDLAKEVYAKIIKYGGNVEAILYQGRNKETCERYETAEFIGAKGMSVQSSLCQKGEHECPFYNLCAYQEQRRHIKSLKALQGNSKPRIFVMTSAYLVTQCNAPPADFVIVDETHWQIFTAMTSDSPKSGYSDLTLAEIRNAADRTLSGYEAYSDCIGDIIQAMQKNPIGYPFLLAKSPPNFKDALLHVRSVIQKNDIPHFRPDDSDKKISKAIKDWKRPRLLLIQTMLEILEYEMKAKKNTASAITYNPESDTVRVHSLKKNMIPREVPVLLIDASADLVINQVIWGHNLNEFEIRTERNAEIIQVRQRTFSKQSIGVPYDENSDWHPSEEVIKTQEDLLQFIKEVAVQSSESILVISSKKIVTLLRDKLPKNITFAHYGALRGKNEYEKFKTAIIIGREEPWHVNVEGYVRALNSRSPRRLVISQNLEPTTRYRRLAGGKTEPETVRVHLDPFAQKVLEQIREQEVGQGLDRLRLINDGPAKKIILLTSVVIDATIAVSKTWDELKRSTRLDKVIQFAFSKALAFPLGDAGIFAASPKGLWSSLDAVGSNVTRIGGFNGVVSLIKSYIPNDPLLTVKYRVAGQKNWSKAMISTNEFSPKRALERVLGKPVVDFRLQNDD